MKEYHKIQTVYLRDPLTNFKTLLIGQWAKPEFEYIASCPWEITEKIDGTNVRVMWHGGEPSFAGKTDEAQMPPVLLKRLAEIFTKERFVAAFPECPVEGFSVCLYGEGYGAKIQQAGGRYIPNGCNFILFDVKVGEWWLDRIAVTDIAKKMGIDRVPILGVESLVTAIKLAQRGFKSMISADPTLDAEGVVLRPFVQLWNRKGERVITKIKAKDFSTDLSPARA